MWGVAAVNQDNIPLAARIAFSAHAGGDFSDALDITSVIIQGARNCALPYRRVCGYDRVS